jgi:hypothetical protein
MLIYITSGMNNRLVRSRSSETSSHSIDIYNKNKISASHGGEYEYDNLLGYSTV